jgi:hypothetical protein
VSDNHYATNTAGERDMFKVVMMITQGFILPFLIWLGVQMVEQRESMARLEERISNQATLAVDRYTASEAAANWRTQAGVDQTQTRDIERLEVQMRNIQEQLRGMTP